MKLTKPSSSKPISKAIGPVADSANKRTRVQKHELVPSDSGPSSKDPTERSRGDTYRTPACASMRIASANIARWMKEETYSGSSLGTQMGLAIAMGVSTSVIRRIITLEGNPTVETVEKVVEALGHTIAEAFIEPESSGLHNIDGYSRLPDSVKDHLEGLVMAMVHANESLQGKISKAVSEKPLAKAVSKIELKK